MPTFTISTSLIETSIEGLARASETSTGTSTTGSNKVTVGPFSILPSKNSTGLGLAQLPIQTEPKSIIFVVGASSQPITSTEGFNIKLKRSDNIVLGTASRPGTAIIKSKANAATSIAILTISCPSCQSAPSILDIQSQIEENAQNYAMSFTIRTKQPDELLLIITAGYTQVYNGYWTDRNPQVNGQQPSNVLGTYVQLYGGVWSSISAEYYLAHEAGEYKIDAMFSSTQGAIAMFVIELATQPPTTTSAPAITLSQPQINGLTVTISGDVAPGYSGASISRIHWEWGDGKSEDHWFPATHTYSNYGTYIITVTVYQSDGLTSTKIVQLVLSRSVASSALTFLGQIKIKASIIKNQTDGSYSFTLQITPINLLLGPTIWLVLDDSEIKELKNNIYNQLIQQGLLSTKDSPNVKSLVVVAPADVIDENAVGLLNQLFSLPSTTRNIIEAWDYIRNFGVDGIVLSSAKFAYLYGLKITPPPPTTIAGRVFNAMYQSLSGGIECYIFGVGECTLRGYAPIYVHTENGFKVLKYSLGNDLWIVGPGQELEIVVKGLKQPPQGPLVLQISGRNAIIRKSFLEMLMSGFRPGLSFNEELGYEAFPSGFSTSVTLICGGGGWLGFLGGSTTNCYSEEITINEHYTLNGVPPTVEVNVYSLEDIIKNVVLEPSAQSIKQDDPLDVSVSFDLDPSFISSLRNLGSESASVQEKPVVTVELYEEKAILGSCDRKISEKSLELQSTGSTLSERVVFNLHGSDLGWLIWHGGKHTLYARITLKYCESEATWITQARWGAIVVETPRVTVSVRT